MFWTSSAKEDFNKIKKALTFSENEIVELLLKNLVLSSVEREDIKRKAQSLVEFVRQYQSKNKGMESFLAQYGLSNQEGIMLMCLAEALLRVPDKKTADLLIKDKLKEGQWEKHIGQSESLMVNASSWALMLTGSVLVGNMEDNASTMRRMISRTGEPIIRTAIKKAMQFLGQQFVIGQTIKEAIKHAGKIRKQSSNPTCFSYDMLGEAAMTESDAQAYFEAYQGALTALSKNKATEDSISVKLSALHPRYELWKNERVHEELYPRLKALALQAMEGNIALTIDAEEAYRLELSLGLFERLFNEPEFANWAGLGLALQAYQKRSYYVVNWLAALSRKTGKKINIRLVKGAYWDTEVKIAQQDGLDFYPVFTRKSNTDLSYLACAQKIIENGDCFFAQFATHNAHTVAAIMKMQENHQTEFEFQRLFGMGEGLYQNIKNEFGKEVPCRVYAPVGGHKELLAYLVRRLLENGANTSFVQHVANKNIPIDDIIQDPLEHIEKRNSKCHQHPKIPLPQDLYGLQKNAHDYQIRKNSFGPCLYDEKTLENIKHSPEFQKEKTIVCSLIDGKPSQAGEKNDARNPATKTPICVNYYATDKEIDNAFASAHDYFRIWDSDRSLPLRASYLIKLSQELEDNMPYWISILIEEAGKTYQDAVAEIREAIDFCRYYPQEALKLASESMLPGPTGESNQLFLRGRGVFVCIAPWNFPLAIFIGQIAAALMMGNTVIAKPAEQTSFVAYQIINSLHNIMRKKQPTDCQAVQLVIGDGRVGERLVNHHHTAGIAFTGSFEVAKKIQISLANKPGPIIPFIAETGGINAMMVDSSALPEQVVRDVLLSGFRSAGQRCSALRLLLIQEDVADNMIEMLIGAMKELQLGNPTAFSSDIGPVIDEDAYNMLQSYVTDSRHKILYKTPLPSGLSGYFVAPTLIEISEITDLEKEVFGPIVHVKRFKASELEKTIDDVNQLGFGLTFGLHSRIFSTAETVANNVHVGNIYVNRNMIGAIVGVQPFGGEGYSGTGPKAGGPHYLPRFAAERTVSVDTTAAGGNASLLSLSEED